MSTRSITCDACDVERFLARQLTDEESRAFESHLDVCAVCRDELDRRTASAEEWNELRGSLQDDERIEPLPPGSDADAYRRLLGPTDDPRMLGRIGTYEVPGVLGRGGMGVVFKAFDPALHRYVAIKLLAPMFLASGEAKQRFVREAQSAAAVVHEHVVGIHAISDWQGTPYLVMTYVRGESLLKRLATRGRLSLREVLRIGMQVAAGLAAAHAQGLMHRDIKPANILLENDVERVKITDFGLARAINDLRLTGSDTLLGTPEYMSPEQARDEPLDYRTDLFSLGCVLYETCTGQSPFRAATSYGAIRKVIEHSPAPVRDLRPDLPAWLDTLLGRLLAKDRDDRFASAHEVAAVLRECLAHVEQPRLAPLPPQLASSWRLSSPFVRRLVMSAPWIAGALAGSWLLLAQLGQTAPPKKPAATAENPSAKPAARPAAKAKDKVPTAQAEAFTLRVRRAEKVDPFRLSIKPGQPTALLLEALNGNANGEANLNAVGPHGRPNVQSYSRTETTPNGTTRVSGSSGGFAAAGGFSSSSNGQTKSGGFSTGGNANVVRPNLGIAFDIEPRRNVILEIGSLSATDEQGQTIAGANGSAINFFDPGFERSAAGATAIGYLESQQVPDSLKSLQGQLRVTPGQIVECVFPNGAPATKRVDNQTFVLKSFDANANGAQAAIVLPPLKQLAQANPFNDPEGFMKAMLQQQGAFEVTLEDSEGQIHYSSGGGSAGGASGGSVNGRPFGNANVNSAQQATTFHFAALPDGRSVKALHVRMTERTGPTRSIPFRFDSVALPFPAE